MKDIIFQLIFIFVFALIGLVIITLLPGCLCSCDNGKFLGVLGSGSSGDGPGGAIDDGKEQLFDAVKGSNWLVTFSILGMAAGVFALVNGGKLGIPVIIASGASLFMALAVARFALWMAVFGFIGAVAAVAISILVKQRALKEIITNVQSIKETAANGGSKKDICKDIKSALSKQAKSTKKLVKKIRAKL